MRKIIFIPFLLMITLCSCYKLDFYGNAFYTLKGKIVDSTNNGIPNLQLSIFNSATSGFIVTYNQEAISATCQTDAYGNYQVTFPGCNSNTYLQIPNGYNVVNVPYSGIGFGGEIVQFNTDTANNYLIVMPTIQIKPQ